MADTTTEHTTRPAPSKKRPPQPRFSATGFEQIVDGTKSGTIVWRGKSYYQPGATVTAKTRWVGRKSASIPLSILARYEAENLAAVPAVAAQHDLPISLFSNSPDWQSYVDKIAGCPADRPVLIVQFETAGELRGDPLVASELKSGRLSADSYHGRPWRPADGNAVATINSLVHPGDREELRSRVAAAVRAAQPPREVVRAVAAVTAPLLRAGACSAQLTARQQERANLDDATVRNTGAWLVAHGIAAETTQGLVWAPQTLAGLRVLHRP